MAKPIDFPEANITWVKPKGMTDEECGSLQAYREEGLSVSCWHCSFLERLRILLTGRIWLGVSAQFQPPVWVTGRSPFS